MAVENKIRVVGIGSAGIRMLEEVQALNISNVVCVAIDTDIECVKNASVEKKLPLKSNSNTSGTGGDTNVAKTIAVQNINYLTKVVNNAKTLVILGGLGGGTATMIAPILAKIADNTTTIFSITALPMDLEGKTKKQLSKNSFAFLKEKSTIAISLQNDVLLANSNEDIESAYKSANKKVAQIVELIASGLSAKAFLKIDESILKNDFSHHQVFAGSATATLQNIENAFLEIKNAPTMESDLKSENMLVAIKCPKSFSMADIKHVLQTAHDSFSVEDKISYSVCSSNESNDVKILAIATKAVEKPVVNLEPTEPEQISKSQTEVVANSKDESVVDIIDQDPLPNQYEENKKLVPESESVETTQPVEFKPEKPQPKQSEKKEQILMEFDERGLFENTPKNEYKNIDIDTPTFIRKGIKIPPL